MLSSCSKVTPKDYLNTEPKLDIRQYLSGDIKAWGILQDRKGKVTRKFVVEMTGVWDGDNGTLTEHFEFDDGQKDKRIWKINFSDDNNFTATAGDVVGNAIGSQYGSAMQMDYILDLEVDEGKRYKVKLDDWMYLIDEKTLVNKLR